MIEHSKEKIKEYKEKVIKMYKHECQTCENEQYRPTYSTNYCYCYGVEIPKYSTKTCSHWEVKNIMIRELIAKSEIHD